MLYPFQNNVRNKLDLSGPWEFWIDPVEGGEQNGWFNGFPDARPMAVTGSWNEQYENIFDYLCLAWYVERTYVSRHWRGEYVFIRVGWANYCRTVNVNDTKVGSHEVVRHTARRNRPRFPCSSSRRASMRATLQALSFRRLAARPASLA